MGEDPRDSKSSKSGCFKWGCGCFAVLTILSGVVFFTFVLTAAVLEYEGTSRGGKKYDSVREKELYPSETGESGKLVVIPVEGVILHGGGSGMDVCDSSEVVEMIDKAEDDPEVEGIIVSLDTPGGEVTAADEIYRRLREYREDTGKPVVALMNSMAASGGYYVAAGCDRIVAGPMTMTGSIGVIMSGYNFSGLLQKIGVEGEVYKSGGMKDMLNPARPRTEEERKIVQEMVNDTYAEFVAIVSKARKIPAEKITNSPIGDGRVYHGRRALEYGMVDELGFQREAIAAAEKLGGLSEGSCRVVEYSRAPSLIDTLLSLSARDVRPSVKVELNGVTPSVRLKPGRLYLLPPDSL